MVTDEKFADSVRQTMADLANQYTQPTELRLTLSAVTKAVRRHVSGTDSADILIITSGEQFESVAPTSPLASKVDALLQEFGEGPCLSAAEGETFVRCNDLRSDQRWPNFGAAAAAEGVQSMLSFQLYTHGARRAALNLLATQRHAFTHEAEMVAAMLATHAATALIAHDKELQFRSALASRDIIGQAKGMIMERFSVDAVRAFELLVKLSQTSNQPVAQIAAEIVSRATTQGPSPKPPN
ncbi:GAF and ANTAR domain-containing protein [Mycobacterium intracellulare]|uniref:GAF and ANTAR domain-containing protein n=1 Tax=Mycobacterium intracellulare TaxID=1767 RepID=A0AAE4RIS8_MYCIT|nr:GAF and ANTAR domain-containing protein [Mycobacterium intracellulare]MDV6979293.1 GAF and ANTAR domain-containing protein [Mycobacterium intracellulare]MDV6984740.1 GAF and ANTAR domain-containing protein [Mycobacterium intracellulare]MDV7014844.1 GAF and ANTAR domain-containing protein [Mycobacterium intracellulare]MDV7031019.1 GAF and ANTAR domain-containing protein [Mycobacterium intracellulare]